MLVPGVMLPRRADTVDVVAAGTVRGWLRRFAARAEQTLQHAMRCLVRYDLAVVRIEPDPDWPARSRWELALALCSGRLLANTNCPYPPLW